MEQGLDKTMSDVSTVALIPLIKIINALIANNVLTRQQVHSALAPLLDEVSGDQASELLEVVWRDLVQLYAPASSAQ